LDDYVKIDIPAKADSSLSVVSPSPVFCAHAGATPRMLSTT